jgi:hypothetical protein
MTMEWELLIVGSIAVLAVLLGFVALFKSGKREAKMDKWLAANIVNDAGAPVWLKEAAQKVIDTQITQSATAGKAEMDAIKAQLDAILAKLPK